MNLSIFYFENIHYQYGDIDQDVKLKMVSQQYRARSDCMDVQADLAL